MQMNTSHILAGFLSILWLASGSAQAVENVFLIGGCSLESSNDFGSFDDSFDGSPDDSIRNICGEARAIAAFGFLNWLICTCHIPSATLIRDTHPIPKCLP
jgi:hypothetical protein